jgi:sulfur-oxidizing protein SoxX
MRQWLMALVLLVGGGIVADVAAVAIGAPIVPYRIVDDGIPAALTEQSGDVARGRDIAANRQIGMCPLCHQVPSTTDRFQGDIASSLAGAGARWTVPQLRLRIVDSRRVSADSVMPSYYKLNGLTRVGTNWRDKPILDAQQVEDVVAWLASLQ